MKNSEIDKDEKAYNREIENVFKDKLGIQITRLSEKSLRGAHRKLFK